MSQWASVRICPARARSAVRVACFRAYLGDVAGGQAVLEPLRQLQPELDTFAAMPAEGLQRLHMDPEPPTPVVSAHQMLAGLPLGAVEAFVESVGPDSGSSLIAAELRQLGGALGRQPTRHGSLPGLDGAFAMWSGGIAGTEELAIASREQQQRLEAALEPWSNRRRYFNFEERAVDASAFYDQDTYRRLREIRSQVDPDGLFHANHPVPASDI